MYPASAMFLAAIRGGSHTRVVKIDRLDKTTHQVLETVAPKVASGAVSARADNTGRRRLRLTVENPDGIYTPTQSTDPFWVNQVLRVWSGIAHPVAGDNTALNSSFEVDTNNDGLADDWNHYNNGPEAMTSSRVTGRSGLAQRVTWTVPNTSSKGLTQNRTATPWKPLTTYIVSFWAKYGTAGFTSSVMQLAWNTGPATTVALLNPYLGLTWQRYAFRITMGATVEPLGRWYLTLLYAGSQVANSLDIDDVLIEETPNLYDYHLEKTEYVPVGTFLVSRAASSKREMTVDVDAQDLWKRAEYTTLTAVKSFAVSTSLHTIFAYCMDTIGHPAGARAIDPAAMTKLTLGPAPLQFARATPLADILSTICDDYGYDAWFDAMGVFNARPTVDPSTQPSLMSIGLADMQTWVEDLDIVIQDSPDIKNYIGVSSTSVDTLPIYETAKDDNTTSPTYYLGAFGTRYWEYAAEWIQSVQQARDAAENFLRRKLFNARGLAWSHSPLPQADIFDVLSFTDNDLKLTDRKFFIQSMDIPLAGGLQRTTLLEVRTS